MGIDEELSNLITKKCKITSVVFYSDKDGYCICRAETLPEREPGGDEAGMSAEKLTVVGYLPGVSAGRSFTFQGSYKVHPKYGEQFSFRTHEELAPETSEQVEAFLSSGIIKGVGPALAKLIVGEFGEGVIEIIADEPEKLLAIPGIGKAKLGSIVDSYKEHTEFAKQLLFFTKLGVSAGAAKKLYDRYGSAAEEVVRSDPYRMISDVRGIGWKSADEIAMKLGVDADDPSRVKNGVLYVLRNFSLDGHTCMDEESVISAAGEMLGASAERIRDAISDMETYGGIIRDEVYEENMLFLPYLHGAEMDIAADIMRLERRSRVSNPVIEPAGVSGVYGVTSDSVDTDVCGIRLSPGQAAAADAALSGGVLVITGGPGTGKTTIIEEILARMQAAGKEVLLAAPTGRAAKRITEATGAAASTIHRLLEYEYGDDDEELSFRKNRDEQLECDAIIIDEASMIDAILMRSLLEAIPSEATLILVGDADQLPSVGPGNILSDLLASGAVPAVRLTDVFRQGSGSDIVVGAHAIDRGEMPYFEENTGELGGGRGDDRDLRLIEREEAEDIGNAILAALGSPDFKHSDVQVLTPVKKGMLGNANLNVVLQKYLNPPAEDKAELSYGAKVFRVGDRVMQTKNDYRTRWVSVSDFSEGEGVFNGDLGYVTMADARDGVLKVLFDGERSVDYDMESLAHLEHAYAVTIHKSQGSEFPHVIIPLFPIPPMLATRNVIYTAVTRGKERVTLVGRKRQLERMIANDTGRGRRSGLASFLTRRHERGSSSGFLFD